MDGVFNAAIEAIALAGKEGLPVSDLWGHLTEAATAMGASTLPPTLRSFLWELLLERHGDIRFMVADGAQLKDLKLGVTQIEDLIAAEASGVVLVAADPLQDAALGVFAARCCRFSISESQRITLNLLGCARQRGALQADLSTTCKIEPRNYSYVVKNLEERGLVVKFPYAVHRTPGSKSYTGGATNHVVLSKFAPEIMSQRCLRSLGAVAVETGPQGEASSDEDERVFGEADNMANRRMNAAADDTVALAAVTEKLAGLVNKTAQESELKVALGYAGKRGHRQWRRRRQILVNKGCIEAFVGVNSASDKPSNFIRLLKRWEPDLDLEDENPMAGLLDESGKLNIFGEQMAEMTLDRQMLRLLVMGGQDGMTTHVVDTTLRFNIKRNDPRFKELRARLGPELAEAHVTQGKTRLLRFTASPAVLQILETALGGVDCRPGSSIDPNPPPGGWVAAVEAAMVAGLNGDGSNPVEEAIRRQDDRSTALPGAETAGLGRAAGDAAAAAAAAVAVTGGPEGVPTPAVVGQGLVQPSAPPAESLQERLHRAATDPKRMPDAPTVEWVAPHRPFFPTKYKRKAVPVTELGSLRRQWMTDHVVREGALLTSDVGAFLQAAERRMRNNPAAVRPDRKVAQRVINAAVAAGELAVLEVLLPTAQDSMEARSHKVIVPAGTQNSAELVDRVMALRQSQLMEKSKIQREILGGTIRNSAPDLPMVSVQKLTKDGEEIKAGRGLSLSNKSALDMTIGEMHARLLDNGMLPAKMMRAMALHAAAWALVGARNGVLPAERFTSVTGGTAFVVGLVPDGVRGTGRVDNVEFEGTPEQRLRLFTINELFSSLTIPQFLEVLGSQSEDPAALLALKSTNRTIAELSKAELITLAGGRQGLKRAKTQLAKFLELLHHFGLLSAVIPIAKHKTGGASMEATALTFILNTKGQYESMSSMITVAVPFAPPAAAAGGVQEQGQLGDGAAGGGVSTAPTGVAADPAAADADTPAAEAPTAPGTAAAAPPAPAPHRQLNTFQMDDPSGRVAYWRSLQFMIYNLPTSRGHPTEDMSGLFPFGKVKAAQSERCWFGIRLLGSVSGSVDVAKVRAALSDLGVVHGGRENVKMTWDKAAEMADQLGMPFEIVARAIAREAAVALHLKEGRKAGGGGGKGSRLGGLGGLSARPKRTYKRRAGAPGGGKAKKAKGKSARRAGSGEESSEEEEEEDDAVLDLMAQDEAAAPSAAMKKRKKKWTREEDRTLLHAWAKWLAEKGPDRILSWRFIKARPRDVAPTSCKHRIHILKTHSGTGPTMMKVMQLAAGVFSRRVLRQAGKAEKAAAGGGSPAEEAGPQAECTTAAVKLPTTGEPTPAAPAAGAVGAKRSAEEAELGQGFSEKGSLGEWEAKRARTVAAVPSAGAPTMPKLWEADDAADAEALRVAVEEIEGVLDGAPNRARLRGIPTSVAGELRGRGGGAVAGRLFGPRSDLPAAASRTFSLLRQWAKGAAAAREAGAKPPAPAVAAAMDLAKSLLLAEEAAPSAAPLVDRFKEEDVTAALCELLRLNHVSPGSDSSSSGPSLRLTDRFLAEMRALFFSEEVFSAVRAAQASIVASSDETAAAEGVGPRTAAVHQLLPAPGAPQHGQALQLVGLPGSTVAAVLSRCVAGSAELAVTLPRASASQAAAAAYDNLERDVSDDAEEERLLRLLGNMKVSVRLQQPATGGAGGDENVAPMNVDGAPEIAEAMRFSAQEEVIFQPSLVAVDAKLRKKAENRCKEEWTAAKIPGGKRGVDMLLRALRAAGGAGLSPAGCAAAAPELRRAEDLKRALVTLCRFGLVRRMAAFNNDRVVDAEAGQAAVAFPPPGGSQVITDALLPLKLPEQGSPQPLSDVPIRPWVDPSSGRLRKRVWESLVRRATATAMRFPGVRGDVLLQSVRIVNPRHGREVLSSLCEAGVLRAERGEPTAAAAAAPPSVLAACFGKAAPAKPAPKGRAKPYAAAKFPVKGLEDEDTVWHYFADPVKCWDTAAVLPPQVLV